MCESAKMAGCGLGEIADDTKPCQRCGAPTRVRMLCGAERHYACQAMPRQTAAPRWVRPAVGRIQPALKVRLADELPAAEVDRAVTAWNSAMHGIEYIGAGPTALKILNGRLGGRNIPALPAYDHQWVTDLIGDAPMWTMRTWTIPDVEVRPGGWLAGWDVNGSYLGAAGCELGSGRPDLIEDASAASWATVRAPGYVEVHSLRNAPHGLAQGWEPGMWMPLALCSYLARRKADEQGRRVEIGAGRMIVWPTHRRWLDPHVSLLRGARVLVDQAARDGDPAAKAVRDILKEITTRVVSGWLLSERNQVSGNRGWADTIVAEALTRFIVNLDRVRGTGAPLVGVYVDAAYYVLPTGWDAPPGLETAWQLGKFKPTPIGRVAWTDQLDAARREGDIEAIRAAVAGEEIVT